MPAFIGTECIECSAYSETLIYLGLTCFALLVVGSFVGRVPDSSVAHGFTLERIQVTADVFNRLASRQSCHLAEFETALSLREAKYGQVRLAT